MRRGEVRAARHTWRSPFTATSNTSGREERFNERVNEVAEAKEHRRNVTIDNEPVMSLENSPADFSSQVPAKLPLELVHQLRRICSLKD